MRRRLLLLCMLCSLLLNAQNYKHIGVSDGLSNRKVYSIQKDQKGYMWFLTHEGVDRYNGKDFKHYHLKHQGQVLNSLHDLSWQLIDRENTLWVIGKKGRVFKYDQTHDQFVFVYEVPDSSEANSIPVTSSFIDENLNIWLPCNEYIYLYNIQTGNTVTIKRNTLGEVTRIIQYDSDHFFVGTDQGLHYAKLTDSRLDLISYESLSKFQLQVNDLYFDRATNQLFIGTFQNGVYIFNNETKDSETPYLQNTDISVTRIKPLNEDELLIATDGTGIYKLNTRTHAWESYIVANYKENNTITGNCINDIYIDEDKRIWIANYPIGVTVRNNKYSQYQWYKHSVGNPQSLINDRVNAITEDSDGDLWFATNNGISLYKPRLGEWTSFLSSFNPEYKSSNNVFLSLCEVTPGVIYVGGYSSSIYKIHKQSKKVEIVPFGEYYKSFSIRPDKYIRSIIKDSEGYIWVGGYYNLTRLDRASNKIEVYPGFNSITSIVEKDEDHIWISSTEGIYVLNKQDGEYQQIPLPSESNYVYSLCQTEDGKLYIGTNGAGLLTYNDKNNSFEQFTEDNSSLLSDNIYTILTDKEKNILFSSESGLSSFDPDKKEISNWTKEQGLRTNHFNQNAGIYRKNGNFVFGSSDGVVEFSKEMQLPHDYVSSMVFSDFKLFYEPVYPNDPGSPLKTDIDQTKVLHLDYNQNIFSLTVSSINYDYPSNILYSWMLEGFYDSWSKPTQENIIHFTNLAAGKYTLRIRAISNENREKVLEERSLQIIIKQPFWKSGWAFLIYLVLIAACVHIIMRLYMLRKQRKIADEKFQFFINTAHDIRTPLTLIKAPLEDISEKEELNGESKRNMDTAMRNVNALLKLTTNLLNFEHIDLYSSNLYVAEHELNTFMEEIIKSFRSYAEAKQIQLSYEKNFTFLNVWFDKEKMDSILKNIISNALKYTPEGGSVTITATDTSGNWTVEVNDTGIGIPSKEQKKLFRAHFRASNAINSKITGSGIGMVLVAKLVKYHKGKITLDSTEGKGTTIKVTFPKGNKHFEETQITTSETTAKTEIPEATAFVEQAEVKGSSRRERILIVEDNDELRDYLRQTLSDKYNITVCRNGKDALNIVKEASPDLIISDIMMPEMRGDELCTILKSDIETSHIPVMLLTALNDEKNILKGLQTGADEYIVKPFNIGILKVSISNMLTNRAILRKKFASLDIEPEEDMCTNCMTDLDWKFISTLKGHVEQQMSDPTFNVDTLASLMHMSRTSMYSKIKALTDMTPSDFVRQIRLNKAAELLKEGVHNVTEIAELTGFNDAKYFREVFKKHFKVSPSKYKEQS